MEDIIQRLVEIDRQCANRVELAKSKKADVQTNMNEKKKEIYNSFISKQEEEIKQHKENLMVKNQEEATKQDTIYQETVAKLDSLYQQNKEQWVNEIVNRCLK